MRYFILFLLSFLLFHEVQAGLYLNVKQLTPAHRYAQETEKKYGIPENLLTAIAHVESKCSPYAVNARGRGYYFKSHEQATKFVQELHAQGVRNINAGYMQLNVPSHLKCFKDVHDMLDLKKNIDFAGALLAKLYKIYGSWPKAVERYKSGFSDSTRRYQTLVYSIWSKVKLPRIETRQTLTSIRYHRLTPHRESIYHAKQRINRFLPSPSITPIKEIALPQKAGKVNLNVLKTTTWVHLVHYMEQVPSTWERTYHFSKEMDCQVPTGLQKQKRSFFSKIIVSLSKVYNRLCNI